VLWVLLALLASGCLDDALTDRSTTVKIVVMAGLATGWTAALVALLVPRSSSLTALRVLVPGGLAAMAAATALGTDPDPADLAALAVAALAVAAISAPGFVETWVDGSSYGPELRLPLTTPATYAFVVGPATWVMVVLGLSIGPLLLAAGAWLRGLTIAPVGFVVAWVGIRSIHQLSLRWVVLVPAGMVLHDPLTMPEAQLFPRKMIARLAPARVGTEAEDLTAGASGLALERDLSEPVDLLLRTKGRTTETRSSTSLIFTPARPARLLAEAGNHRIRVE